MKPFKLCFMQITKFNDDDEHLINEQNSLMKSPVRASTKIMSNYRIFFCGINNLPLSSMGPI